MLYRMPLHPTPRTRRQWLAAVLLLPLAAARAQEDSSANTPGLNVSRQALQDAVRARFPRSVPVYGLFDITLQAPTLALLPASNQLQAQLEAVLAGPALRRSHTGSTLVDFGLRYEPSDRSIRAERVRVQAIRLPGLRPEVQGPLDAQGIPLAETALEDAVLHTLTPEDLALPEAMGLRPGAITVTAQGLHIAFAPK